MTSKQIPKFNNASEQTRVIGGLSCSVRRLSAGEFFPFISRLLADVGPLVARILSSPDDDLDPAVEAVISSVLPGGMPMSSGKIIVMLQALESAGAIDIGWYGRSLLPKHLSIEGVAIDSMQELDETGIGMAEILELLSLAFIVNVGPTFAGLATQAGSGDLHKTANPPIAMSNLRGATKAAGPSAPTSPTAGQYSA